tara:strand:+ start:4936 stop:5583 length:648 start_codon:yes stop_codon:yes gene_type:complete
MTTGTQEDEAAIASFIASGNDDVVPEGHLKMGDQIADETGKTEGITVEDLAFKGYAKVWDNRTGREVLQPKWILWQTFTLKRPDGSRIFTHIDPKIPPDYGLDLVCLLHPESPDYSLLQERGFKPCFKKHAPTKVALNDHMRHTHKRAYAALKDVMEERRREEDRELQLGVIRSNQELIQAMAGQIAERLPIGPPEAPLYVSDKPKRTRRTKQQK